MVQVHCRMETARYKILLSILCKKARCKRTLVGCMVKRVGCMMVHCTKKQVCHMMARVDCTKEPGGIHRMLPPHRMARVGYKTELEDFHKILPPYMMGKVDCTMERQDCHKNLPQHMMVMVSCVVFDMM